MPENIPEEARRDMSNITHLAQAVVALEERLKHAENTNAVLMLRIKRLEDAKGGRTEHYSAEPAHAKGQGD